MSTKNEKYPELNLNSLISIEEKFESLFSFLQINMVLCEIEGEYDLNPMKAEKYLVTKITVLKGNAPYIHSLTKEIRKTLIDSIDYYIENSETTLFDMVQTLKIIKDKCVLQSKINNIHNSMEYDPTRIIFLINGDSKPSPLYFDHLVFTPLAKKDLIDHFLVRFEFYNAMIEILGSKISELSEPPSFEKQPYKWTSENPHYEIAELLYALINKRIQIKDGEKGSKAKLVKNFYNLFGLDESTYHQKLQQVRKKKKKRSWLHELSEFIDDVQKSSNPTKN